MSSDVVRMTKACSSWTTSHFDNHSNEKQRSQHALFILVSVNVLLKESFSHPQATVVLPLLHLEDEVKWSHPTSLLLTSWNGQRTSNGSCLNEQLLAFLTVRRFFCSNGTAGDLRLFEVISGKGKEIFFSTDVRIVEEWKVSF